MGGLIKAARTEGWEKAVTDYISDPTNYFRNYIIDESRADWHMYLSLDPTSTILDIGAGWGAVSIPLARWYGKIYSADVTYETLKFLKIRAEQEKIKNIIPVRINPLDYPKFPFPDSYFDLVVLNGVLEWVGNVNLDKDPLELQKEALCEIRRILKTGGYVYIGIENRYAIRNFLGGTPHGELPFVSVLPRKVANLLTKIVRKKEHRTYIHSMNDYYKILKGVGYSSIDFYWPRPSYRMPRTIIPLNSEKVLKYWIKNVMASTTIKQRLFRNVLSNIIPKGIYCSDFGIVGRKY